MNVGLRIKCVEQLILGGFLYCFAPRGLVLSAQNPRGVGGCFHGGKSRDPTTDRGSLAPEDAEYHTRQQASTIQRW